MKLFFILIALLLLTLPAYASDFTIQADSVEAMNGTMDTVKTLSIEDQSRFVALSMAVMEMILAEQEAKGTMDAGEMDAAVRQMMHGKTLDELDAYIQAQYNDLKQALPLDELKGNYRALLVFGAGADNDVHLQEQSKMMRDNRDGLNERDFYIEIIKDTHSHHKTFDVANDEFTVILIGKDGVEKQRWDTPITMTKIFEIVDEMPMRQRETNKKIQDE